MKSGYRGRHPPLVVCLINCHETVVKHLIGTVLKNLVNGLSRCDSTGSLASTEQCTAGKLQQRVGGR